MLFLNDTEVNDSPKINHIRMRHPLFDWTFRVDVVAENKTRRGRRTSRNQNWIYDILILFRSLSLFSTKNVVLGETGSLRTCVKALLDRRKYFYLDNNIATYFGFYWITQ
ncbi:hypothetical protein TNIN_287451 [Trichonephila inaurata madagascariensis]|uniref:Uncharacterized protein n=1 Tax=Trichonephila inaurata madagascariensis TaxID=2747483 RepID=A0A8X6XER7_9ARAC|nr:hypothetical protein TNIN_287451 [Trichonephila inaurata madagascariensis]